MNIKYDNSIFTNNPPNIIIPLPTPQEVEDEMIRNHIDEETIANGFIDLEALRNRELIKNGKNERTNQCF